MLWVWSMICKILGIVHGAGWLAMYMHFPERGWLNSGLQESRPASRDY